MGFNRNEGASIDTLIAILIFIILSSFGAKKENCKDPFIKRAGHNGSARLSELRRVSRLEKMKSLDEPVKGYEGEDGSPFVDFIRTREPQPDEIFEEEEFVERFYKTLSYKGFTERQIKGIKLTSEGYTQTEIAQMLGVTHQAVSLWIRKAKKVIDQFIKLEKTAREYLNIKEVIMAIIKYKNANKVTKRLLSALSTKGGYANLEPEWILTGIENCKLFVYAGKDVPNPFIEICEDKENPSKAVFVGEWLVQDMYGNFSGVDEKTFNKQYKMDPKKIDVTKKGFASESFKQAQLDFAEPYQKKTESLYQQSERIINEVKNKPPKPRETIITNARKDESLPTPKVPEKTVEMLNVVEIIKKTEKETKAQIYNMAVYLKTHNLIPDSFKTNPQAVVAIQTCFALGFKRFGEVCLALKNMYVLKGEIHLWGDLPLSLVYQSDLMEDIDEYFIDKNSEKICVANKNVFEREEAAICEIKRKGFSRREFIITSSDLEREGLKRLENGGWEYNKGGKKSVTWLKFPKNHWKYRARALALKGIFTDVLKGRNIFEHDHFEEPEKEKIEETVNKIIASSPSPEKIKSV